MMKLKIRCDDGDEHDCVNDPDDDDHLPAIYIILV
jgi:hypothetical protein